MVSNQDTLTSEEANPASHYYVSCYPLKVEDLERPESWKIWRRNHRDGPLDDNWTSLRLRKDESSERLIITETRKEWVNKFRKLKRTHYSQDLHEEAKLEEEKGSDPGNSSLISPEIDADLGTPPPDVIRVARVQLANLLLPRAQEISQVPRGKAWHSEYQGDIPHPGFRDFLSSRIRYSAYIKSSVAFLDLVIDDELNKGLRVRMQPRMRKTSPIEPQALTAFSCIDLESTESVGEEDDYVNTATRLWPPDNAPQKLLAMLNPVSCGNEISYHAASDERSIIYMANPPCEGSNEVQPIILINFDPAIEFPGLPKLGEERSVEHRAKDHAPLCEASGPETHLKPGSSKRLTYQKVPASWKSLRQGFKLR